MRRKQMCGFIGAALLSVGAFMPIASAPGYDSVTYLDNDITNGAFVLIFVAISLVLTIFKQYNALWFVGTVIAAILISDVAATLNALSELLTAAAAEPSRASVNGFRKSLSYSIYLQWGWILLFAGAFFLIASAALKNKKIRRASQTKSAAAPTAPVDANDRATASPTRRRVRAGRRTSSSSSSSSSAKTDD